MGTSNDELQVAVKELKDKTPPPMNTMMEKQSRSDALEKRAARSKLTTQNVPPTTPVHQVTTQRKKERQAPKCSVCKQPMKGHKNVADCPKNQS